MDTVASLKKHYQERLAEIEEHLRYAETKADFRMVQVTVDGERDVTEEHRQRLRKVITDYKSILLKFDAL